MSRTERAEQIRALAASLRGDDAERDRLKTEADESLARLHRAVREFSEGLAAGGLGARHSETTGARD